MKTYAELRKLDVSQHVEKKGGLSYLSWTYAVDQMMLADPTANWEFLEPMTFGETMMVRVKVTALGKTMTMHLPVMDNRNQAVKSPDSRKISDAMMRCLVKGIAVTTGIGLYIFAGEDAPEQEVELVNESQAADLKAKIQEVGVNEFLFLKWLKVAKVSDLPAAQYAAAIQALEERAKRGHNNG